MKVFSPLSHLAFRWHCLLYSASERRGGEGPPPLVEVNQVILAWSANKCTSQLKPHECKGVHLGRLKKLLINALVSRKLIFTGIDCLSCSSVCQSRAFSNRTG